MELLRGLRLNCHLVPALPAAAGIVVVVAVLALAGGRRREALDAAHAGQLRAAAAGEAAPLDLVRAEPSWTYAAVLRFGPDERVEARSPVGEAAVFRAGEPTPALVAGFVRTRAWRDGGTLCATASLPDGDDGSRRVLYAERPASGAGVGDLALYGTGALVLAGLLLGLYGARHLYRPVESLQEEAEAALEDRPARSPLSLSPETAGLSASISALTQRVRESDEGGDGSRERRA